MAKLKAGAEVTISMSFLVMGTGKILRLLRLFFPAFCVAMEFVLTPHETARRAGKASGSAALICKQSYRRSWGRRHLASMTARLLVC